MTNRSDRIKAHMNAKKLNEDAAGDVLRATAAKHKLKRMEGTKKSPALIAKLTARVAAGKRYQTEEAVKKVVTPAPKPVKPLTNNPGYGYHGIADRKHKSDANKAHAAYNAMHAKVKNWAGEAGHLAVSKKPNEMVRDYLDSKRGRYLEGLEADEKYIKKDFGHFSRSYDPKLFVESKEKRILEKIPCGNCHGTGIVKSYRANARPGQKVECNYCNGRGYHNGPFLESMNEDNDDYSGVYSKQDRDGNYKNIRIKAHPKLGYAIHLSNNSVAHMRKDQVKDFIHRTGAMYVSEETISEIVDTSRVSEMRKTLASHGFTKTHEKDKIDVWDHHKSGLVAFLRHTHDGSTPSGRVHLFSMRTYMVHENHHDPKTLDRAIASYKHHTANHFDTEGNLNPRKRLIGEETLTETSRTEDAQRVQYGVMKRDDYLRKWKIGKFGEKKNRLAGPGGLYNNLLVGSNIDNKSAATKK